MQCRSGFDEKLDQFHLGSICWGTEFMERGKDAREDKEKEEKVKERSRVKWTL